MICRYHNHQKTLNLKYIPKSENILINSESSLFSILRKNGIRIVSAGIRGGRYFLKIQFPDGSMAVFSSETLQSTRLITAILSHLNQIQITLNHRQSGSEAVDQFKIDDSTSTGLPVFIFKPGA